MMREAPGAPFLLFSMPFSDDAWLANWLRGSHNELLRASSLDEFCATLAPGSVETASFAWKALRLRLPKARFAVVLRSSGDTMGEFSRRGLIVAPAELLAREATLQAIAKAPGSLAVEYGSLRYLRTARELHRHLLPQSGFDEDWWMDCMEGKVADRSWEEQIALLNNESARLMVLQREILAEVSLLGAAGALGLH